MNMNNLNEQGYFSIVIERLKQQNYQVRNNIKYDNQIFEYVVKRTKFEIERGGLCTTFFLFSRFKSPDNSSLKDFSAKAFRYAKKASGIHLPRGLFYSMWSFPVAIVDSIDSDTIDFIHRTEPPRHWCASEKLVVFNLKAKTLYYCTATFTWGSGYYDWDRKIIKEMLSP
jgi:hypothetical protein